MGLVRPCFRHALHSCRGTDNLENQKSLSRGASARADKLFRSAVGMAFARRRDGLLDKRPVDAARSDGRAVRRRGARILSRKKKSVRTDTARKGQKRRITTKGTVFRPFFNEFLPRGKNLFQSSYPLRACFPR